ncbi:MAG: segregation/condensation protein A [Bacilli bacterium]
MKTVEYEVKLEEFEGPLDLLLHFVKESKVDILDIKIEDIANQYLAYIKQLEALNLNIASEYLVLASELIEIKSRLLLPVKQEDIADEEDDPKEVLINRLIEYQRYKDMTKNFKELEEIRQEIHTKSPEKITEYVDQGTVITSDITLDDLVNAFGRFLKRQQDNLPIPTKVTNKEITVANRRIEINQVLKEKGRVNFFELFNILTREYIVVTFLAILEMAKEKELKIEQEDNFEAIFCEV